MEKHNHNHTDYYYLDGLFLEKPEEKYSCPICLSTVQREAYLTQCCGNHFCLQCIRRLAVGGRSACPMCNSLPVVIFPNKERQREINGLRVNCPVQIVGNTKDSSPIKDTRPFQEGAVGEGAVGEGTVPVSPGPTYGNTGDLCDWVGELGAVDSHLKDRHKDDKQWKACCDEASCSSSHGTNQACLFHLNQSLQQMNIQSRHYHVHHRDHLVTRGASDDGRSSNESLQSLSPEGNASRNTSDRESGGNRGVSSHSPEQYTPSDEQASVQERIYREDEVNHQQGHCETHHGSDNDHDDSSVLRPLDQHDEVEPSQNTTGSHPQGCRCSGCRHHHVHRPPPPPHGSASPPGLFGAPFPHEHHHFYGQRRGRHHRHPPPHHPDHHPRPPSRGHRHLFPPGQGHHHPHHQLNHPGHHPLPPSRGHRHPFPPGQGHHHPFTPGQGHHRPFHPGRGHHHPPFHPGRGHHHPSHHPHPPAGQGHHHCHWHEHSETPPQ